MYTVRSYCIHIVFVPGLSYGLPNLKLREFSTLR